MRPDRAIHVFINKQKYELSSPEQTGTSLKAIAGIPTADVLFLQQPGDDLVITIEAHVTLKNGDRLHSQPPADYGSIVDSAIEDELDGWQATIHRADGGWSLLEIAEFQLPLGFRPDRVRLLLKLAPTYPDAAPDMFWVYPHVKAPSGCPPRATSSEHLLGLEWQRFSWHLATAAWIPGISTLRDYLRCVAARFQRFD